MPPARLERWPPTRPGLYAEVADPAAELEERTWLAFLIAYSGPLDGDEPFAAIGASAPRGDRGELPPSTRSQPGPRGR